MRPPLTDVMECATVCAACAMTWQGHGLLYTMCMLCELQVPCVDASERARVETMLMRC